MAPNLEVIVGTYEQFLLGYTVDDVVNKYKMEQSFATHSHLGSIRSVATNKHYLASAAADDTISLYDMRTRTESGKLTHHNDTVNSISFTPDGSHIITTSNDGSIGIIRCGNWQIEKHWLKPHKGFAVDTLAVHPTGKIAMTTGHDGVLRTWNLVKGRQAYATNLVPRWKINAKNICALKWSPNGNGYLLAANNKIDIYLVETAGIQEELIFDSKVVCVEYLDNEYIAVGLSDGKISIYNIETGLKFHEIQAHNMRVKCLVKHEELLVSASSSGEIKLWSCKDYKLILLNTVDCNARISCLTLTSYLNLKFKKEEIDIEEKVPKDLHNKLRSKQKVIIEDEDNEKNKITISNKKKNKKTHKLIDNDNTSTENIKDLKKIKLNINKKSLSKKHKSDIIQFSFENPKKKKLSNSHKKRKKDEELAVQIENQFSTNKKKRKNPDKGISENLQKKQKIYSMKSKLKKKNKNVF